MANLYAARDCPSCGRPVGITILGKYRSHKDKDGQPCESSGDFIPIEERSLPADPSDIARARAITASHARLPQHSTPPEPPLSTSHTDRKSSGSDETETGTSPTTTASGGPNPHRAPLPTGPPIPGVDEYAQDLAEKQLQAYRPQYAQPAKVDGGYAQPAKVNPVITEAVPMGDLGKQITVMLREIFYQFTNQTGRSAQSHLGPSQIGTACSRRLAMSIMQMPHVNPGSDGWAAFVGTAIHAGLADMLQWADARKGRFATEQVVKLPSKLVPKGTADLLDRVLFMVDDHKAMGQWSLDKLKREGPSQTYRVQLQVYALGMRMRGERVDHVALIAWPRDKPNLDDLYTWTTPYDPAVAREALDRVERIGAEIEAHRKELEPDGDWSRPKDWEIAGRFEIDTSEGCRYCPFYGKDAKDLSNGSCNGRK